MTNWQWGSRSKERIETCSPVLKPFLYWLEGRTPLELTVVWGFRGKEAQNEAYDKGHSGRRWPDSKHNYMSDGRPCSLAVDLAPWLPDHPDGPIPWKDRPVFLMMAGMVLVLAQDNGLDLINGSDWNQNWNVIEHGLIDPAHFQLVDYD